MNIFITGGSRGIGKATVELFREKGDRVGFTYLNSPESANSLKDGKDVFAYRCDVTDEDSVCHAISLFNSDVGEPDVLVNCAGVASFGLFQDIELAEWKRTFSANVEGTFLVTKHVLPGMIRRHSGSIVNISSLWGINGSSNEVCYSSSKAAIIGMTKALAKEVGPSGIRVNCVAPGFTDTEMNKDIDEDGRKMFSNETPLGRIARPEEIAKSIYFFSSDDSSFTTGQVLAVDGGYTV